MKLTLGAAQVNLIDSMNKIVWFQLELIVDGGCYIENKTLM